jgi:hypothetical protein
MSKKKTDKKKRTDIKEKAPGKEGQEKPVKLTNKAYEKELSRLQGELIKLQLPTRPSATSDPG